MGEIDKCCYCSTEYHPMPIYTRSRQSTLGKEPRGDKPLQIWVCHLRFVFDDNGKFLEVVEWDECAKKAEVDGYEIRWDLTPKR